MNIIVCVEDRSGIAFNHRRVSRDRKVVADIEHLLKGRPLYVRKGLEDYFEGTDIDLRDAAHMDADGFFFADIEDPSQIYNSGDELVVYRWNRRYPADVFFAMDKEKRLPELRDIWEFQGSSHDRITREIRY